MFDLRKLLAGKRFTFSNEKELQRAIKGILEDERIGFIREYHIAKGDIIDFYLPSYSKGMGADGIGIEVKIKGDVGSIIRQCERYLAHDCIETLYLVTSRQQHVALYEESHLFKEYSVPHCTAPSRCQLIILEPSL